MAKALKEPIKVINAVDRLGQNLEKDLSSEIDENYTRQIMKDIEEDPVTLVDDSDIIKPHGKEFEDLGIVRDGSSKEKNYKSANMVTFNGLEKVIEPIDGKGTFVFDRGYDMNSMFQLMHEKPIFYYTSYRETQIILER